MSLSKTYSAVRRSVRIERVAVLLLALAPVGCGVEAMPWQTNVAAIATPIAPRAGCTLWHGRLSGNDPNVVADLELCPRDPDGEHVVGRVQYRSDSSGHSIRRIEGRFDPSGALVMKEVGFDVNEPELLWMFCLVDRYELRPVGDARLVGKYDSKACSDHARLDVQRVR